MAEPYSQTTSAPTTKVTVGALAGALTVVLVYICGLFGLVIPAEVAAAVTVLISFGASYIVRERA